MTARNAAFLRLFTLLLGLLLVAAGLAGLIGLAAGGTLDRFDRASGRRRQPGQQNRTEDQLPLHVAYVTTAGMNGK